MIKLIQLPVDQLSGSWKFFEECFLQVSTVHIDTPLADSAIRCRFLLHHHAFFTRDICANVYYEFRLDMEGAQSRFDVSEGSNVRLPYQYDPCMLLF